MNPTSAALATLFGRIPRRHSIENVAEINSIVSAYKDLLINIEAVNAYYEKKIPIFFDELDAVRASIKKSTDNKASKKNKDSFFDEASGALKDSMQELMELYGDGEKIEWKMPGNNFYPLLHAKPCGMKDKQNFNVCIIVWKSY